MTNLSFTPQAGIDISYKEGFLSVVVTGVLRREDVVAVIREHYQHLGNRNVVWDLSKADISGLTIEDMKSIAEEAKVWLVDSRFTRVVYIGVAPALYLKMCLYTAIAAMAETPADYAVFQTETEALEWLKRQAGTAATTKSGA